MGTVVIYVVLVLVGLCLGSFAGAMVWRLRARQLIGDKAHHEEYDKEEYDRLKKLMDTKTVNDHSRCLHCTYTLRWYDLIPIVSWVSLKGRCRQCRKPIGYLEPLIELGVALLFVLSYAFWPYLFTTGLDTARFIVWLIAGVGLAILFAYDTKWLLLPDKINFGVIGLGVVTTVLVILQSGDILGTLLNSAVAVAILSGIYFVLYIISRGKWIGLGDIKLGLGLALLLGNWQLAFIALFAANLIGCLIVLPQMAKGRLKRNAHIPFGPLLIAGTIVAQLVGFFLIDAYLYGIV